MTPEKIKRMMDACYQAKRIRELLPPLPSGVTPAYIQYMDVINIIQASQGYVRISDVSDYLKLPRPGVTRDGREGLLKKEHIGGGQACNLYQHYRSRTDTVSEI